MKIELVTEIVPPPPKKNRWAYQRSGEAEKTRQIAYALLNRCEVGQHVVFHTTDRARVTAFTQSPQFFDRNFSVHKLAENKYGVWRTK